MLFHFSLSRHRWEPVGDLAPRLHVHLLRDHCRHLRRSLALHGEEGQGQSHKGQAQDHLGNLSSESRSAFIPYLLVLPECYQFRDRHFARILSVCDTDEDIKGLARP